MQLPWRQQIVEGMLGADLVGFQRPVAAQNFMQIARRLVDVHPAARGRSRIRGARCASGAFPVSIDFAEYRRASRRCPRPRARAREPRERSARPAAILLGVDRLDYTKGIDVRLQAFRELLAERRDDGGRDGARAGRDAEPRARDHLPPAARARRARRRAHQRRVRAPRPPGDPLPAPQPSARRPVRALRGCRCHARDARCATA